jgi:hypothetical protein
VLAALVTEDADLAVHPLQDRGAGVDRRGDRAVEDAGRPEQVALLVEHAVPCTHCP